MRYSEEQRAQSGRKPGRSGPGKPALSLDLSDSEQVRQAGAQVTYVNGKMIVEFRGEPDPAEVPAWDLDL